MTLWFLAACYARWVPRCRVRATLPPAMASSLAGRAKSRIDVWFVPESTANLLISGLKLATAA